MPARRRTIDEIIIAQAAEEPVTASEARLVDRYYHQWDQYACDQWDAGAVDANELNRHHEYVRSLFAVGRERLRRRLHAELRARDLQIEGLRAALTQTPTQKQTRTTARAVRQKAGQESGASRRETQAALDQLVVKEASRFHGLTGRNLAGRVANALQAQERPEKPLTPQEIELWQKASKLTPAGVRSRLRRLGLLKPRG